MTKRTLSRDRSLDPLFTLLSAATADLVLVLDARHVIRHVNASATGVTGYPADELVGAPWSLLSGSPRRRTPAAGAVELWTKDGRSVSLTLHLSSVPGEAGGTLCVGRLREIRSRSPQVGSEAQLHAICESMEDGVAVCDDKGKITMCNAAFARMAGRPHDEVVGAALPYPWTEGTDVQTLRNAFRVFSREGTLRNQLVAFQHKERAKVVVSLTFASLRSGAKSVDRVVVTARDVSDVQYAQEVRRASDQVYRLRLDVQRKAQRLETLQEVNASVLRSADPEAIFSAIVEGTAGLVGHDLAGIYLFDPERNAFFAHTLSKRTPFSRKLAKFPLAMGEGIIGEAALSGTMVLANNAHLDPRSKYPPGMRQEKEHFIAVPLRGRFTTFGILVVARNRDPEFIEEEAQIVRTFADAATVALENAQLHVERRPRDAERRPPGRRPG